MGGKKHKETFQIINHSFSANYINMTYSLFKQEKPLRVYLELRRYDYLYSISRNIMDMKSIPVFLIYFLCKTIGSKKKFEAKVEN